MEFLLYTIHVLTSLFLILVVLLQQGKGADLSVFGGGGTMTAFGARGAASLLHKLTVTGFVLFIVTTLAIGIYQKRSSSVVAGLEAEEVTAEAEATPAGGEEGEEEAAPAVPALPEAEEPALAAGDEAEEPAASGEEPAAGGEGDAADSGSGGEEGGGTENSGGSGG